MDPTCSHWLGEQVYRKLCLAWKFIIQTRKRSYRLKLSKAFFAVHNTIYKFHAKWKDNELIPASRSYFKGSGQADFKTFLQSRQKFSLQETRIMLCFLGLSRNWRYKEDQCLMLILVPVLPNGVHGNQPRWFVCPLVCL